MGKRKDLVVVTKMKRKDLVAKIKRKRKDLVVVTKMKRKDLVVKTKMKRKDLVAKIKRKRKVHPIRRRRRTASNCLLVGQQATRENSDWAKNQNRNKPLKNLHQQRVTHDIMVSHVLLC